MALGTTATILFADLCGFTRLSNSLDDESLDRLLDRFEGLVLECLTLRGGRLVKLIGDEVMIVAPSPELGARLALDLVERAAADDLLPGLKAGLSHGPVLVRRGDCFGATVNRASRIVDVAACGTVLTDDAVRVALGNSAGGDIECVPQGVCDLKDFDAMALWRLQHTLARTSAARSAEAL